MSFQAMTWAVGQDLPCKEKMVLMMLANRTNQDTGRCDPSHKRLAFDCGLSESSVKRAISQLSERGLLNIEQRLFGDVNLPNQYVLEMGGVGSHRPGGGVTVNPGVGSHRPTKQEDLKQEGKHIQDEVFEMAWAAYPKRDGSNPKAAAQKCWNARLKEGVTVEEMMAGINRYKDYCMSKETIGTAFVMQAARFLGTNREYEAAWSAPAGLSSAPAGNGKRPRPTNLPEHKFPHPEWDNGVYEICTVGRHNPKTGYLLPGQY
jgi:hypothetical protein